MEAPLAIQEFLEYVVAQLIQHPENAGVLHRFEGDRHEFRIRLHPEDIGRVIGKNCSTISAIRSLVTAAAMKNHLRVDVEIEDRGDRR